MLQSNLKVQFGGEALAEALSIAWDLLIAADHPSTQGSSAEKVRERMANRIRLAAVVASDEDDLWVAALDEVQFEPRLARSSTSRLAKIWEMSAVAYV